MSLSRGEHSVVNGDQVPWGGCPASKRDYSQCARTPPPFDLPQLSVGCCRPRRSDHTSSSTVGFEDVGVSGEPPRHRHVHHGTEQQADRDDEQVALHVVLARLASAPPHSVQTADAPAGYPHSRHRPRRLRTDRRSALPVYASNARIAEYRPAFPTNPGQMTPSGMLAHRRTMGVDGVRTIARSVRSARGWFSNAPPASRSRSGVLRLAAGNCILVRS